MMGEPALDPSANLGQIQPCLGETLVTVEFRAVAGGTELVLTHERFAVAARMGRHQQGWTELFDLLERYTGGRT
jgi:uncharacterized protein YndB with AHSA1/START domain